MPRARTVGAAALIVWFFFSETGHLRAELRHWSERPPDALFAMEARLAPLSAALPERGMYGWIGEPDDVARYFQSEHVLAPRVLARGDGGAETIVGLFDTPPEARWLAERGLEVARDFGRGVLLLRKRR
jgi:hypothetical protein